jgi:hypothetical protein
MKNRLIKLRKRVRKAELPLPAIGAIAVTRGLLGLGAGLLLSKRIPARRRRAIGLSLVGVGVASTVPLVGYVMWRV